MRPSTAAQHVGVSLGSTGRTIRAGNVREVRRDSGQWLFVDLGFAHQKPSCGVLCGDGDPEALTFAAARDRIVRAASTPGGPLNLVVEAPLSVAFTEAGNPAGRSIEKRGGNTRYWYVGLGCSLLVAATYLVKAATGSGGARDIRVFEGFVSFKARASRTSHADDVLALRRVVWDPGQHPGAITAPDDLRMRSEDVVSSAFAVAGLDIGVPPVITAAPLPR